MYFNQLYGHIYFWVRQYVSQYIFPLILVNLIFGVVVLESGLGFESIFAGLGLGLKSIELGFGLGLELEKLELGLLLQVN